MAGMGKRMRLTSTLRIPAQSGHGVLLCSLLAFAAVATSASAAERDRVRAVTVPKGPPIDGTLADPAWLKSPKLTLHPTSGFRGDPLATSARVLFDERFMYVAFECAEPDTGLRTRITKRDGNVWLDDCVELYISADPASGYKQIVVNPLGVLFDQNCAPQGGRGSRSWNGGIEAKAKV
jgi:hypothetical protein